MTVARRLWVFCLGLSGFVPAGCAIHVGSTDPVGDPGDGIRVPKETKFASMVQAPGETVSLAGPMPVVAVTADVAPPGTVAPPAPTIDIIPNVSPADGPTPSDGIWPLRSTPVTADPFLQGARAAWEGRPDRVADALRTFDKPTQDALRPLLVAGANLALGQSAADPKDLSQIAAQMRTALAAVERRAELRIENARFIRELHGFRWYDALPKEYTFRPKEYAYLYFEVSPLAVDPLPGGGIGTHVSYTLRLLDSAGKPVPLVDHKGLRSTVLVFEEKVPRDRGPMSEKHLSIGFAGPELPGRYLVELETRDQHTGRVAKETLEYRVGGR